MHCASPSASIHTATIGSRRRGARLRHSLEATHRHFDDAFHHMNGVTLSTPFPQSPPPRSASYDGYRQGLSPQPRGHSSADKKPSPFFFGTRRRHASHLSAASHLFRNPKPVSHGLVGLASLQDLLGSHSVWASTVATMCVGAAFIRGHERRQAVDIKRCGSHRAGGVSTPLESAQHGSFNLGQHQHY
ncbi:hypothetical protein CBOM_07928 [Ceraceosorus bombacis]|uniref:Uncharacterized protein n=1 Tax=Ceraceosorus bombacis TaxID=401625 RepID=A0A0P1BRI2_9BASI|nr:hypothetical protein CBOM_07928 [Ceraceosorus bombacis]